MPRLELLGAEVPRRGVYPHPVAESLDALEDLERCPLARLEGPRMHAPGPDGAHERLHGRVVPRGRDGAHRGLDAGIPHGPARQQRGVPAAAVAVVHAALPRAPPRDRHLQRVVGGLGAHAARHRPADDHPRPYVHDGRQVEPALMGPRVRDVGEPGPVRPVRAEIAAKQVRRGAGLRRGDKVNIKIDDRVTVPSSLARLHNRHWRHGLATLIWTVSTGSAPPS